jgi:hypothetical protein
MGGGHQAANPHGPVGGRKGRGDVKAECILGRKGMYKSQRRRGPLEIGLDPCLDEPELTLEREEAHFIMLLSRLGRCSRVFRWDQVTQILELIGVANARTTASEFIQGIVDKTHGWLRCVPYCSIRLNPRHAAEIQAFLNRNPTAKRMC